MSEEAERLRRVFEQYSTDHSTQLRWDTGNAGNRAIVEERSRLIEDLLRTSNQWPPHGSTILDIGCGHGEELARFVAWGARPEALLGVDLVEQRIQEARSRHPEISFRCEDASRLDVVSASVDLVLVFTVFSSILDSEMSRAVASEIDRVLKDGGAVLWYDYRVSHPLNPHTRAVSRRTVGSLFPGYEATWRTTTVVPQLVRRLGRSTDVLYPALARLPILRTHLLGILEKPAHA